VLIIEDDEDVALAYQMMLRTSGYRVTIATHINELAASIDGSIPDAVILDIHLQHGQNDFGGLEILRLIDRRAAEQGVKVPMIVVSGAVDDYHRRQAIEAGASLFLPKPIRVDELAVRVGMIIQQMGSGSAKA
jgi:DNA-binding response OmpR family regulator